jgi:hypothetical protein
MLDILAYGPTSAAPSRRARPAVTTLELDNPVRGGRARRSVGHAGRTAWARNLAAPVRDFLSTETGGTMALLVAAIVALLRANSPWSDSYESVWTTNLAITIGDSGIAADLRQWVNEGLMTFFFLVVGLEAKRELDLGELRERRHLPLNDVHPMRSWPRKPRRRRPHRADSGRCTTSS